MSSFTNYPSSGPDAGLVTADVTPTPASGTAARVVRDSLRNLYDRLDLIGGSYYTGQVATGCFFAAELVGTAQQWNSRTPHCARDAITSIQIAWANFYGDSESAPGAAMTVEAAIEYPVGTITRITFSGGNVQTIANGQMGALSDAVTINIPQGALFYVRSYTQNTSGVPYWGSGATGTPNRGGEFGTTGVTNKVMSGSISASGIAIMPVLIVGVTMRPSVFVLGDSIGAGTGDTYDDLTNEAGIVFRSIAPYFACAGYVKAGGVLSTFNAYSTKRRAVIAPYFTHVINQYAYNDLGDAGSASTVLATLAALPALTGIAGKKLFQCTITPRATSSDSFATEANQTAINATERANLNKQIVAGLAGYAGFFDVGREAEGTIYSGKFRVDLGLPTADNVHPSNVIYRAIRRSKAIDPALIRR